MGRSPADFESAASASSAIPAGWNGAVGTLRLIERSCDCNRWLAFDWQHPAPGAKDSWVGNVPAEDRPSSPRLLNLIVVLSFRPRLAT